MKSDTTPPAAGVAASVPHAIKPRKTDMQLRCLFTKEELLEKGKNMSDTISEIANEEGALATIKSQFKSKIEGLQSKVNLTSEHIRSGYEYRQVACEVVFDKPARGQKTTTRLDTNEVVEVAQMASHEMQYDLPIGQTVDGAGNVSVAADGPAQPDKP